MKKEYVVIDLNGYDKSICGTKKEVLDYVKEDKEKTIKWYKEHLEREEQDLKYFYEGQYDKMSILDRPYFLERGEEGLKDLEKQTKENIEELKYELENIESGKSKYKVYQLIDKL